MKLLILAFIIIIVAVGIFLIFQSYFLQRSEQKNSPSNTLIISAPNNMKIMSPVFGNGGYIPAQYTCDGENVNPPLEFSDVPENARSLVLIVDDPDAPGKDAFVHWTLWNIPVAVRKIEQGGVPAGAVEGHTSFGRAGYGGPCPPSGVHRYFFRVYAVDTVLALGPTASRKDLEEAIQEHIIAKGELMGKYQRR